MTALNHTALHAEHEKLGAAFTDFGGWDMPLKYQSELAEHRAVREAAGLFDLSHMGEVWVSGPDAAVFLNTALVGDLAVMRVGKAKYTLITDVSGGIIDDLIVYRIADERFLVVPNAGNAPTVAAALVERAAGFDVEVVNASAETSLIAVQGPKAEGILIGLVSNDIEREAIVGLGYYAWIPVVIDGVDVLLARTGYTGEDGFELFIPNEQAAGLWQLLLAAGEPVGLIPCGLASRDSLRLEAGMPLYGNELGLDTNPYEARLGGVVSLKKAERFVGRDALEAIAGAETARVLVGLKAVGRRAGRSHYAVHASDGREVGAITSGLPSPTLGYPVALAYVDREFSELGTVLDVDLRGRFEPFEVIPTPFYRRAA